MPSPGQETLATDLGSASYSMTHNGETLTISFNSDGDTIQRLATAMDSGWTITSPTSPTSFESTFNTEFSDILGQGKTFMDCIATALDTEVDVWIASWDTNSQTHTYVPSASTIKGNITSCSPVSSAGVEALAQKVADTFISYFEQEVG